jgi:hypothetical protein
MRLQDNNTRHASHGSAPRRVFSCKFNIQYKKNGDMPPSVKVRNSRYKIIYELMDEKDMGECTYDPKVIRINSYYGLREARKTLLHEILHAIYFEYGLEPCGEERTILTMEKGIFEVFTRNKKVRGFIFG